jgi:uncharacterized protein YjdB
VKSVKGKDTTSLTVKKVGSKSVSKKNVYKLVVKAYRTIDGEKVYTGKSYTVYTAGSGNTKYTDPKSITVSKKSVSLSAGKTAKISAKVNKVSDKKKLFSTENVPTLRYFSSDTSVAKVSASGKIKAVAKGSCTIYVVGTNGVKKSVKVTVK